MTIVKFGKHSVSTAGAPNVATQVVNPSDNVAGMVIRTLTLILLQSGSNMLFTGPTAPSSPADVNQVFRIEAAVTRAGGTMPYELELPAGYGLWIWPAITGGQGGIIISYDLYTA